MKLSWRPRRKGYTYCSSACGRGCTIEEHNRANKEGRALASKLGQNWKVHLWENLGWHYEAVSPCGQIRVSPSGFVDFDAAGHQIHATGHTPVLGLKQVMRKADEVRRAIERAQAGVK